MARRRRRLGAGPPRAPAGAGAGTAGARTPPGSRRRPPLAEEQADPDERGAGDQPGDEPLGAGAEETDRSPALLLRGLRVLDVADDRIELTVGDVLLREPGHQVGAD